MGADIHTFVEVRNKKTGKWELFEGEVFSLDEYVDMKEKLEQELKFLDKEKTKKPEKVNIKSNIKTMLKELKACDDNDITRMKAVLHKYISHIYYTPSNVYIKWVRS